MTTTHCTSCGVTLGDSWCAACASKAPVERLTAELTDMRVRLFEAERRLGISESELLTLVECVTAANSGVVGLQSENATLRDALREACELADAFTEGSNYHNATARIAELRKLGEVTP